MFVFDEAGILNQFIGVLGSMPREIPFKEPVIGTDGHLWQPGRGRLERVRPVPTNAVSGKRRWWLIAEEHLLAVIADTRLGDHCGAPYTIPAEPPVVEMHLLVAVDAGGRKGRIHPIARLHAESEKEQVLLRRVVVHPADVLVRIASDGDHV